MRTGIEDARDRIQVAAEIRRQHFHARFRQRAPHLAHGLGEMMGTAVFQVIAVDAGDDHVAEAHFGGHARHVGRLGRVEVRVLPPRIEFGD